jgi:hypothetical protein
VEGEDVSSSLNIQGSPSDYTITYDAPVDFSYNQVVDITIDAQDLASPPNVMNTFSYWFTTQPDTTPPVISNISVTDITCHEVTISWDTDDPATSQVEYGLTTSYGSSTTLDPNLVTTHSQNLTGLSSSTLYHYRVRSRDQVGNQGISPDYTFTTLATSDATTPVVTVTAPNGGEVLTAGQVYTITWNVTDNVGATQTSIYYSHDGGSSYDLIDSLSGNPGSYDWTVPSTPFTQCLAKVYAYDQGGSQGWDVSDNLFTIQEAPIPYIWVKSIDLSLVTNGPWTYAKALVLIWDQDNNPVARAEVYSHWDGLTHNSDVFNTKRRGTGSCNSDKLKNAHDWWYYYVDDVVKAGYVFRGDLGETSDSIYAGGGAELSQNYPNPFNPVTSIQYSVGDSPFMIQGPVHTTLKIYNIQGQLVKTLVDEPKEAGNYRVIWDGKNENGKDVATCIYFSKLKVGDYTQTRKMILIK